MPKTYEESLLGDNEKILLVERQHWLVLAGDILTELIFLFVILGVVIALLFIPDTLLLISYKMMILVVAAFLGLLPLVGLVRESIGWRNRQYIITNLRVIQISGVINKNVIDSSLEKVNDVKMEQSALGRLFDYGNVEILTASELGINLFRRIASPIRFKTTMLNAKERLEHEPGKLLRSGPPQQGDIPALIDQLDQLRQRGVLSETEFQQKKAELLAKM